MIKGGLKVAITATVAISLFITGCDQGINVENSFVKSARYAGQDQRLPVEFRNIVDQQAAGYAELTARQGLLGAAGSSGGDIAKFIEQMRQSNWRLTSMLADQIRQLSADGPPIKRINAWTAILAMLDYADLDKSADFDSARLAQQVVSYYENALANSDIDAPARLLHVDINWLLSSLENADEQEKSENVRSAAQPVINKLRQVIANNTN